MLLSGKALTMLTITFIQWLTDVFLAYLNEWQKEVNSTPELTKTEMKKKCLSRETLEGLSITGNDLHDIVPIKNYDIQQRA